MNDLEKQLEILKAKLEDLRKSPSKESEISTTFLEIGIVCNKLGKNDEALSYYNQFLKTNNLPNENLIIALNNTGVVYYNEGKYEEALNILISCWK